MVDLSIFGLVGENGGFGGKIWGKKVEGK